MFAAVRLSCWVLTSSWDWDSSGLDDLLWLALKRSWGSHDCGYKSGEIGVLWYVWNGRRISCRKGSLARNRGVVSGFRYRNFFVSLSHPPPRQDRISAILADRPSAGS